MSVDEYIYSQPEEIHEILFSVRNIMATTHMKFSKSQDTLRQMSHLWFIGHFMESKESGSVLRPCGMRSFQGKERLSGGLRKIDTEP